MKNFYEASAIDISNCLQVKISLIEHNNPNYTFTINGAPITANSKISIGLLDEINLSCKISNGAVEVSKATINGYDVLPIYQHLANPATNWIVSDWQFKIPSPFYPWYHNITGQGWIA